MTHKLFSERKNRFFSNPVLAVLLCASITTGAVHAAEPVMAEGAGVAITAADLTADAQRMPVEARKNILSKPGNVSQVVTNLYVRRAMAAEAERSGLANDPVVTAALQIARDRVLSDAHLARLDETHRPTDTALDAYAASIYKVEAKRFQIPEEIRARHILVATATPDAKAKAEKLLSELKAGANFETVAREQSADPGSAAKGGDLGFFAAGRMAKEFNDAAFALKNPGDLSNVIETQFGFHVIKLEERKPAAVRPFEEVRESLRQESLNKIFNEGRNRETQRLIGIAKFDQPAIDGFAASQK